jgi:hypothetical protein
MCRVISLFIFLFFISNLTQADELDDFKDSLERITGANFEAYLKAPSMIQERAISAELVKIRKLSSIINLKIRRYANKDLIYTMRFSSTVLTLINSYKYIKMNRDEVSKSYFTLRRGGSSARKLYSTDKNEQNRLAAVFLLRKWIDQLKALGYPDFSKLDSKDDIEFFINLITEFKMNVTGVQDSQQENYPSSKRLRHVDLGDLSISPLYVDYIKRLFYVLSKATKRIAKNHPQKDLNLNRYLFYIQEYLNELNLPSRSKAEAQAISNRFNYSIDKLSELATKLVEERSNNVVEDVKEDEPEQVTASDQQANLNYRKYYAILRRYRENIMGEIPPGDPISKENYKKYLRSMIKTEYNLFSRSRKYYIDNSGYDSATATTIALKKVYTLFKSNTIKFSQEDLENILKRIGYEFPNDDTAELQPVKNIEEDKEQTPKELTDLEYLKKYRTLVIKDNNRIAADGFDKRTLARFEKSLSQKEKTRYDIAVKKLKELKKDSKLAKSLAARAVYVELMTGKTKLSKDELSKIVTKLKESSFAKENNLK